jgi:hypothetical protein
MGARISRAYPRQLTQPDGLQIYLDYMLFMEKLIKEAMIAAKKDGDKGLTTKALRKVQQVSRSLAVCCHADRHGSPELTGGVQDVLAQFRG